MARTIMELEIEHQPAAGLGRGNRGNGCLPSERIIHYFLDDLPSSEQKKATDHFSECEVCSTRLLALEISAKVSLEDTRVSLESSVVGSESYAASIRPSQKSMSRRMDRQRSRRATTIGVAPLDDRELLTGIASPIVLGALTRLVELKPLPIIVPATSNESPRHHASDCSRPGTFDPRIWDLAISELIGTSAFDPISVTIPEFRVAA
jgi:hypothetical protein